ncbi:MAG: hypothetical protein HC804_09935, partial [Anaerolineae bacterium]|nr:hypothetical protein [Anaerolineae bacterium]
AQPSSTLTVRTPASRAATIVFCSHRSTCQLVPSNTRSTCLTADGSGAVGENPAPVHWTPQNSRRFRALPVWMTLLAYGRDGYRDIVERNCAQANWLGEQIDESNRFRLLAPVLLNVVCFTLAGEPTLSEVEMFLTRVRDDGRVFLTPTIYQGVPAIRAAFSNWQTTDRDLEISWQALQELAA